MTVLAATSGSRVLLRHALRAVLPLLIIVVVVFFALTAPGFLSVGNLSSLVLNNVVLLAIVAIGMTWAVAAGGIDLSVGTAVDFASLTLPAARELARFGIRVMTIAPGIFETPMMASRMPPGTFSFSRPIITARPIRDMITGKLAKWPIATGNQVVKA